MRKIYISIIAFLLSFLSVSAQYTPMTGFGYQFKRIVVDSTLQIPSFCGVPTLRNSTLKNGGIAIDTCNNKLYKYTRANGWSEVGGGAGGNFIDSLKRSNDSVFARKNSVWIFQYKDSTGGSSQNLQQVTDQGATTTNTITIDDGSRAMAIYEKNISNNNYNLLRYYDGLSGDIFKIYDSTTANSGGIKYENAGAANSFELSVNSYDTYKFNMDNGDYSFGIVQNKIEVNNSNTFETIIPVTNQSGLHDTTYFPVNDATKDTIATLRDVRGVNVAGGYGSVYDTAGVVVARVRNIEATTLQRGEVVYIFGSTGNTASVKRANNKQDSTSSKTFGIVRNPIVAGDTGIIVTQGQIDKLNLGAYNEGDILWLDSVSGQFTKNKPTAPLHQVFLGVVERANNGNGLAYVKVQNGVELEELHNVRINGVANNDVLMYESSTQLWKNKSVYVAVDTSSLSNRINTKLNISDTSVFDRKSAAAYTFRANGTNATANMTDFTFRDTSGVYTGSILWNGTAPSGATNHYYQWQQIGKMVKLQIVLSYATVGSATSQVTMALPSDCPAPALPAFNAGASSILYQGFGLVALNTTSTTAFASGGAGLRRNAANNDNELFINFASTGPRVARLEVTYRAQ